MQADDLQILLSRPAHEFPLGFRRDLGHVLGDGKGRDFNARIAALGGKAKARSNGQSWKVSLQMAKFMEMWNWESYSRS